MKTLKVLILSLLVWNTSACSNLTKKPNSFKNKESIEEKIPKMIKPNVKKIWIPDEIRNNGTEYIEGHYMYLIERNSTWSK